MLTTDRLVLRAPVVADAAFLSRILSVPEVTRWLANVPCPYAEDMAVGWLSQPQNSWPDLAMVTLDGALIGCVDTQGASIGYWLDPAYHGRGYMTEAAGAARDAFFERSDASALGSGFFEGNVASEGVLRKLGFQSDGEIMMHNVSQGRDIRHLNMVLTRADWASR
ncbi:GNAT family N-acetyltransferase [Octadecabacter sp.]|nr:GNAT family N-acetyltransferase [Octadecabacter sp.]